MRGFFSFSIFEVSSINMKKSALLTLVCILSTWASVLAGGNPSHPSIHRCASAEYWSEKMTAHPELKQQYDAENESLERMAGLSSVLRTSNMIYTIPVVVHVVWRTASQNISDAQVQSQIDVLNEDFAQIGRAHV